MSEKQKEHVYDSNPFTISFRGFGLLAEYAKGVVIAIVVLGLVGFVFNTGAEIIATIVDDRPAYEQITSDSTVSDEELGIDNIEFSGGSITITDTDGVAEEVNLTTLLVIGATIATVILILLITLGAAITALFDGVIAAAMVASIEQRHISFGEAFSAMGKRYGTLYVAEVLATLRTAGGLLLFIVPGVRAHLRYIAVPFIIMSSKDDNITATQALDKSKNLYKGHLMEIFGIQFVGGIIPVVGTAISSAGVGMSAHQIQAYQEAGKDTPETHILNYLGVFIVVGIVLLIGLVITLLALAN